MVQAGVTLGDCTTTRDLKSALTISFKMTGYQLNKI